MGIKLDTKKVKSEKSSIKQVKGNIYNIRSNISSKKQTLPSEILYKNNISADFNSIGKKLEAIELKLVVLEKFTGDSMDSYETADYKIKQLEEEIMKKYGSLTAGAISSFFDEIKGAIIGFNSKEYLMANGYLDFRFKFYSKYDKANKIKEIFIKLNSDGFTNNAEFTKIKGMLTQYLGGSSKWDKAFVDKLTNGEGIKLIKNNHKYESNINKFKNSKYETLVKSVNNVCDNLDKTIGEKFISGLKKGYKDNFNLKDMLDDFNLPSWKGSSNSVKVTKGLGIIGTLMTVGGNLDNFVNKDTGKVQVNASNTVDFVVDSGVDIAAGAGAATIGGAVGSLILPPLGTVVGLGVGMVAGTLLNTPFFGGESIVDVVKDGANYLVDGAGKVVSNICSGIGKQLASAFW